MTKIGPAPQCNDAAEEKWKAESGKRKRRRPVLRTEPGWETRCLVDGAETFRKSGKRKRRRPVVELKVERRTPRVSAVGRARQRRIWSSNDSQGSDSIL